MTKWEKTTLAEIADVRAGSPAPQGAEYFDPNGVPFVRVQDVGRYGRTTCLMETKDRINQHAIDTFRPAFAKAGTILFPKSGAAINTNSRAILGTDAYVVSHLAMVAAKDGIVLPEWLYFWFCSFDLASLSRTTSLPSVRLSDIKRLRIPLPEIVEQRRIVARIKECMERVEEIERLRAEASDESKKLSFAVARDFFKALEQDIGTKRLTDFAEINPRRPRELANYMSGKKCTFVPMDSVSANTGNIEKPITKSFEEVKKGFTYFVTNDVIFAKITPCMQNGKCAIARDLVNGVGFGSTEFHVIRPGRSLLPDWIWLYLRLPEIRADAQRNFRGSAGQQRVPKEWLLALELPIPPLDRQKKICMDVMCMTLLAQHIRCEVTDAAEESLYLRESILRKAFAGEL